MNQQNPYRAPITALPEGTRVTRCSRSPLVWLCAAYYGLALLWGARSALVTERTATELVFQVALVLCLALWAVADARQRDKPIPRSQQFWFLVLAWIVVPGYVIGTRGWKGLGWVVFHAIGWFALAALWMHIAGFLYFGSAWLEAVRVT